MTPPTVFISYTHDSLEHKDAILVLSERLRQEGVDCVIDQYEQAPAEGWPSWCERQVEQADFVLVACTETYLRRFKKEEVPGKGLGGTWEGHVITQELYEAQGRNNKFVPIVFRVEDFAFIPITLRSTARYGLDNDYELLYRRLTDQPPIIKAPLGNIQVKAPLGSIQVEAPRLPAQPRLERREDFEPLSNLPSRRSVFFTGREQVLTGLRTALEGRGVAALSGLGGMGKTQTSLEYAHRYRQQYKALFWVDADSREQLLASFVSIATVLNLPSAQAREQQSAVIEVHRWLQENPDWLLIFDNADDLPLIRDFLPGSAKGHLLLTTREHAVAALAERVRVEGMSPDEGTSLLLRRTGRIAKDGSLADASAADLHTARELSKELGGLPLAIDQAGAFIEEKQLSLSEYAELYASEKAALLAERGSLGDHLSVTVTFALAFRKVAEKSAAAGDLLRLCAFLAPDAIPEEIFTACDSSVLGEALADAAKNKLSFITLIGDACRFSLLDRDKDNQTLEIHRLVQVVTKAEMSEAEQRSWAERAVRAVNNAFPSPEYESWPRCQRLIAQAQACASLIDEWEFDFVEAARLLNQAAFYLDDRALYTEAEPLYLRSLAIREKALGPDHPDVAKSLNNLAALYHYQGRYAEAEPLYNGHWRSGRRRWGQTHPDVANGLNNLATLPDQGRYAEAEPLYQRSLRSEKALGPEHPTWPSLNNLALSSTTQGQYAEAEPLY